MPTEPRTHEPRAVAKRDLIVETALSAFAERGYQWTKCEDVAAELTISKGSVFQRQRALRIEQFVDLVAAVARFVCMTGDHTFSHAVG